MRRIQIHIEEELDDALAVEAAKRGQSKASLIRDCVRRFIKPAEDHHDPIDDLVGIYQGSPNESQMIDDVVYGREIRR